MKNISTHCCGSITCIVLCLFFALLLGACQEKKLPDNGDISFAKVALADKASFQPNGYLMLTMPSRRDYLAINQDFGTSEDCMLGLDLADFMQAGLDPSILNPADFGSGTPVYDLPTSTLLISFDLGSAQFDFSTYKNNDGSAKTAVDAQALMAEIIHHFSGIIRLDPAGQLFSLDLGKVASLGWATKPELTDPDLYFALDPAPLIKAGLDPAKLKTWKIVPLPLTGFPGQTVDQLILAFKLL